MNKRANGPSVFRNFFHVACSAAHTVPSGRVRCGIVFQRQAGRRVLQVFTTFRLLNSEPSERGMFQGVLELISAGFGRSIAADGGDCHRVGFEESNSCKNLHSLARRLPRLRAAAQQRSAAPGMEGRRLGKGGRGGL